MGITRQPTRFDRDKNPGLRECAWYGRRTWAAHMDGDNCRDCVAAAETAIEGTEDANGFVVLPEATPVEEGAP